MTSVVGVNCHLGEKTGYCHTKAWMPTVLNTEKCALVPSRMRAFTLSVRGISAISIPINGAQLAHVTEERLHDGERAGRGGLGTQYPRAQAYRREPRRLGEVDLAGIEAALGA